MSTEAVVAGRYRLLEIVGSGGMGVVWEARDEVLDRQVAVKEIRMPPGLGEAECQVLCQRAVREARSAARLSHPGVVTVFDVVEEDGRPWVVMELVRARSLQQVIHKDGPLPPGWPGSAARSSPRWAPHTAPGSCTGTSSRRTFCWGRGTGPSSPTSESR